MLRSLIIGLAAALVVPAGAAAHVTMNPGEWEAGGFARFVVRVPSERPDARTTEVTLRFPESVVAARFQPHPTCDRTAETEPLEEPVDDVSERLVSVTWTCPGIAPDEFEEFGVSFRIPDTPGEELVFPAVQTYSSGEVVRWIGSPDADEPAPRVAVLAPADDEEAVEDEATDEPAEADEQAAAPVPAGDDGGGSTLAIVLSVAALAAALAALALALARRPGKA